MALDADQIEKPVRKLRNLIKKMRSVPSIEQVHDLRTNSRRMEAMLQALSLDSTGNGRRILKELSRLRKRAGKVRDMDVLTGYVARLPAQGDEKECSVQLLEHLGAERQKQAKRLYRETQQHAPDLRKRLKRTTGELENLLPQNGSEESSGNAASADAGASALRLLSELAQPMRLSRANLHPYRLKVKELRNVLRMADQSKDQEFLKTLGEVKDAIGEWHDWEELVAIAKEELKHDANCGLIRELKKIADERYEIALAQAEAMRKEYLRVSNRGKRATNTRERGPGEPVWSATAALVA